MILTSSGCQQSFCSLVKSEKSMKLLIGNLTLRALKNIYWFLQRSLEFCLNEIQIRKLASCCSFLVSKKTNNWRLQLQWKIWIERIINISNNIKSHKLRTSMKNCRPARSGSTPLLIQLAAPPYGYQLFLTSNQSS